MDEIKESPVVPKVDNQTESQEQPAQPDQQSEQEGPSPNILQRIIDKVKNL